MSDDVVLCVARVTQRNIEKIQQNSKKEAFFLFSVLLICSWNILPEYYWENPVVFLKLVVQVYRLNEVIQSCSSDLLLLKDKCSITSSCFQSLYHGLSCSYLVPPFFHLCSASLSINLNFFKVLALSLFPKSFAFRSPPLNCRTKKHLFFNNVTKL